MEPRGKLGTGHRQRAFPRDPSAHPRPPLDRAPWAATAASYAVAHRGLPFVATAEAAPSQLAVRASRNFAWVKAAVGRRVKLGNKLGTHASDRAPPWRRHPRHSRPGRRLAETVPADVPFRRSTEGGAHAAGARRRLLPQLERLPVIIDRPAVPAQMGAANRLHPSPAEMAAHAIAVVKHLTKRRVDAGAVV